MKPLFLRLSLVLLLAFASPVPADELSDLKEQMKTMQTLMEEMGKRIGELERKGGSVPAQTEAVGALPPVSRQETSPPPSRAEEKTAGSMSVFWKNGLRIEDAEGRFKFKVGGRIFNDWMVGTEDAGIRGAFGEVEEGTHFRMARLGVKATLYDRIAFKTQFEFAGGDAVFKDVYVGLSKLPVVGNVRIGQFKEPFGLEKLTSARYMTFMERGTADTFTPSRNTGLMFYSPVLNDRMTWAAGIFRETDKFGGPGTSTGGEWNFTGRLTGVPWHQDEAHLLHLGGAYSRRSPADDTARYSAEPEADLVAKYVDTSPFTATSMDLFGAEAALVLGPFSAQAEFMHSSAHGTGDPNFSGYYVYGSYFLTGEHRRYELEDGKFDRVDPAHNFLEGGPGAWEVGLRYSRLDLSDRMIAGGELEDITAGLNWYLNPNARLMWNYVYADRKDIGEAHIGQMRVQVDF